MSAPKVNVVDAQREVPLRLPEWRRLASRAAGALRLRGRGLIEITFISSAKMRALNRRFKRHDYVTDVLSFRYPESAAASAAVIGEILISPRQARRYAAEHGLPERVELARYVAHGLLHWQGHTDATAAEQAAMRRREDRVLRRCGWLEASARHPKG